MDNPIIIQALIGIILFLCVVIIFLMYTNYQHQKTFIKAILSKNVYDFKATTETSTEDTSNSVDQLIPLNELSDEDFDKAINVK